MATCRKWNVYIIGYIGGIFTTICIVNLARILCTSPLTDISLLSKSTSSICAALSENRSWKSEKHGVFWVFLSFFSFVFWTLILYNQPAHRDKDIHVRQSCPSRKINGDFKRLFLKDKRFETLLHRRAVHRRLGACPWTAGGCRKKISLRVLGVTESWNDI